MRRRRTRFVSGGRRKNEAETWAAETAGSSSCRHLFVDDVGIGSSRASGGCIIESAIDY